MIAKGNLVVLAKGNSSREGGAIMISLCIKCHCLEYQCLESNSVYHPLKVVVTIVRRICCIMKFTVCTVSSIPLPQYA